MLNQKKGCGSLAAALEAWRYVEQSIDGHQPVVDGKTLTVGAVVAVAKHGCAPMLSCNAASLDASVNVLKQQLEKGYYIYGVNTGFGGSADVRTSQLISLQAALLQHTQAGILTMADTAQGGPVSQVPSDSHAMPDSWIRAAIIVRCNSTVRGHSAVPAEIVTSLLRILEHGITPVVPIRGSVSASGDLMPLSYIAGTIEGSPDVFVRLRSKTTPASYKVVSAREALLSVGIEPHVMGPKEGLSIANGTSVSAGLAALVMYQAHLLSVLVQALSATAVEALLGNAESFHPFISRVRPHGGQIECARNVLHLLQGSSLAQNMAAVKDRNRPGLIQDRYSLRSVPQWIGPQLEDLQLAHLQVETELNSSCDNPLVDTESNDIYYGCNFQAASITSAMEKTRVALQMLGKLIFSQTTEMINPNLNNGLPTNLVADDPNLSFTMKGVDTNMAAYMAELAYLAHPMSAHIQAAEMHNQSVNSMALASSRFSNDAAEVLSLMCACHLYVACQALDLRVLHLIFLEQASQSFHRVTDAITPEIPPEVRSQLAKGLGKVLLETWPTTNTLAIQDRCSVVAQNSLDVLLETLAKSTIQPSLVTVLFLKKQITEHLSECYEATRDEFITASQTPDRLGRGSRILYKIVREELGVPFHLGLVEHPDAEISQLNGRDKRTIGSWISKIYEAIRHARIFAPLMNAMEIVNTDYNTAS